MTRQAVFGIAIAAGLASGLMALAGLRPTPFAMPLLIAAPAAVYIASLGWGTLAGIMAAVVACAISLFWHGPEALIIVAGLLFVPAAFAGHLANLAQSDADGSGLLWYPLSKVLLRLMAALGAGFVLTGMAMGYEAETVNAAFRELFREILSANPDGTALSDEVVAQSAKTYAALLPAVIPGMWLLAHVLVMHFSAVVAARSGLLARPAEDLALTAVLPASAIAVPVAGIIGMFVLPTPAYEIAAIATGLGIAGFGLTGLAELHLSTRGRPGRQVLLVLSYLSLVIFGFPILILAVMGVVRSLRGSSTMPPRNGAAGPGNRPSLH